MPYRPQFAYPPPPPGFEDYEFEYYFDSIDYPALGIVPSNGIVLPLQADAEFRIRGFQISGNTGELLVRFWDALGNPLSQVPVENDLAYAGTVNGLPPVGRLPVPLPDEIICPAGSALRIDLASLT
jgi:hypothetical protein